jgi:hypothetical protein
MKKTLGLLSISVLSTALFTGCPGDSGKSASVGVGNQVNLFANETCDVQASTYSCSQNIGGVNYSTPAITFATPQEFCSKITDYNLNRDTVRGQAVAQQTRNSLYQQRCQGVGQTGNIPTTTMGLKTFECLLQVQKGNNSFIGEAQQFQVPSTGTGNNPITLFANGVRNRKIWGGIINTTQMVRLATVKMEFSPALPAKTNSMDQIRMSVVGVDGDISAKVTGFAGAATRIEVTPQDTDSGQTALIASCRSLDATIKPVVTTDKYACVGEERSNGKTIKINYVNQVSDVVNSGISITNSVFVQGADSVTMDAGAVNFSQTTNSFEESTVSLSSSLSAATSIAIEKIGYSLKVNCSPK